MENKEKIIIEYYQEGHGQKACAEYAHVSLRKVREYLIKNNIPIRSMKEAKETGKAMGSYAKKITYTPEQEKIVLKCYVEDKRGQEYSRKQAGCSLRQLKQILDDNNISIRDFSQAASLSNINRAKDKDKDYFYTQSPNMAWILGFLASDGNVSKDDNTIKIGLSSVDREILEKIKEEIHIENDIKEYTTYDGFSCVTLAWCCQEHKQELATYSIVPNKTFILEPPYKLDRKYWIDYIRGYFDGDGSINLIQNSNGRGNGNLRWQVCSATKSILEFIVDFFYEEYGIPKVNILSQPRTNQILYYIQYSSSATREIYKHLYTPNSLYLARKKKHFEEILTKVKLLNEISSHETTV